MGIDPISLGMMAVSVAGTVASAAQKNKQQKQLAGIQSQANAETDEMRKASAAAAAEGRGKAEGYRQEAEDIFKGTVAGYGRPDLERRFGEGTAARQALYDRLTAGAGEGAALMPGRQSQVTKNEQALQLGKKLGEVRANLAAKAKLVGTDEGFREAGRGIDENSRLIALKKDLGAGQAKLAGQTQGLIGEQIANRDAEAKRAQGYLADAQSKQLDVGGIMTGAGQLGGMAAGAGMFGDIPKIGTMLSTRSAPTAKNLSASLKGMTL